MRMQWLHDLRGFDVSDLSFRHAGAWSARRQCLIAAAIAGALIGLGYLLLLQAPLAQLHQQRAGETSLKKQFEAKVVQVSGFNDALQRMQALQTAWGQVIEQLPNEAHIPGLLDEVSRIGMTSGLSIEHMQWLPEAQHPFYTELPLHITLSGGYHEFALFVSAIEHLPRIVTLHDFTLRPVSPAANSPLRITLLAKTYRTNDQGLIP